jgi:hypothetical protein
MVWLTAAVLGRELANFNHADGQLPAELDHFRLFPNCP